MKTEKTIRKHLLVCQGRVCQAKGSKDLYQKLQQHLDEPTNNKIHRIKIISGGCFGLCKNGINIVERIFIFPDKTTLTLEEQSIKDAFLKPDTDDLLQLTEKENETVLQQCQSYSLEKLLDLKE